MSLKVAALWLAETAFGTNKKAILGGVVAAAGTAASAFLGGWDTALQLLLLLMVADYGTGLLGAIKTHTVNSDVMFWGGVRKGVALFVIILAVMLDQFVGGNAPVFRKIALYYYAGREGLSVVENFGILGVPLPPGIAKFLEQLQEKGQDQKKQ